MGRGEMDLQALLGIAADYGEDLEQAGKQHGDVMPLAALRHPKEEIERALLALRTFLRDEKGRALLRQRYPREFAERVLAQDYLNAIESSLLSLASFVPDPDAALCRWESTLRLQAIEKHDASIEHQMPSELRDKVAGIRANIDTEMRRLYLRLNPRA